MTQENADAPQTQYWLYVFNWQTWQEFLDAGAKVVGFPERRWRTVQKMQPGDLLLCYLSGVSRYIGVLEITGDPYKSYTSIWSEAVLPCRVQVRVVLSLRPEFGVPVSDIAEHLSYFQAAETEFGAWGHYNASPTYEPPNDAAIIIDALKDAAREPQFRDFDTHKLDRRPVTYDTLGSDEDTAPVHTVRSTLKKPKKVTHDEIQYTLLTLGSAMGMDVWVARNDRGREYAGHKFADVPRVRDTLPAQFDALTSRIIEMIDVLWLYGNSIVAAFEVEHTSTVYSGLLRMSDLVALHPNINIDLYIVAPDERREKVMAEINRPTFARLQPPLRDICRFIPYSVLRQKVEAAQDFLQYLRPEILEEMAESLDVGVH